MSGEPRARIVVLKIGLIIDTILGENSGRYTRISLHLPSLGITNEIIFLHII